VVLTDNVGADLQVCPHSDSAKCKNQVSKGKMTNQNSKMNLKGEFAGFRWTLSGLLSKRAIFTFLPVILSFYF